MSKPYRAIFFDLDGTLLPMDQDAFVKRYFGLLSQYFAAEGFDPKAVFAAVLDGTRAMIRNDGSRTNEDLFWDVFCKSASLKKDDVYRRFNAFYDTQFDFSRDATGENPEARDAVAAAHSAADLVVLSTNPLFPPAAIRAFCERVGVTKIESESDPALLEWCVREELNKTAARRMAVLDPVKLVIENFTGTRTVTKPNNPLDAAAGTREIPFSRELWIDRADFQENPEKKFFRLAPGREVRLAGACIVTCTGFEKDAEGKITLIRCTWDEGSWGGNPSDGRKVKGTIHWVDAATAVPAEVRLYDRLFTVPDPLRDGPERFLDYMNRDSLKTGTAYVEPALAAAAPGERFQFERTGYFVADTRDSKPGAPVFNRTVTLKDSYRPA